VLKAALNELLWYLLEFDRLAPKVSGNIIVKL